MPEQRTLHPVVLPQPEVREWATLQQAIRWIAFRLPPLRWDDERQEGYHHDTPVRNYTGWRNCCWDSWCDLDFPPVRWFARDGNVIRATENLVKALTRGAIQAEGLVWDRRADSPDQYQAVLPRPGRLPDRLQHILNATWDPPRSERLRIRRSIGIPPAIWRHFHIRDFGPLIKHADQHHGDRYEVDDPSWRLMAPWRDWCGLIFSPVGQPDDAFGVTVRSIRIGFLDLQRAFPPADGREYGRVTSATELPRPSKQRQGSGRPSAFPPELVSSIIQDCISSGAIHPGAERRLEEACRIVADAVQKDHAEGKRPSEALIRKKYLQEIWDGESGRTPRTLIPE